MSNRLGPKIAMISKMTKDLADFMCIASGTSFYYTGLFSTLFFQDTFKAVSPATRANN